MREALDQWDFVIAAYAVGVIGTLGLVIWSWLASIKKWRACGGGRARAAPVSVGGVPAKHEKQK